MKDSIIQIICPAVIIAAAAVSFVVVMHDLKKAVDKNSLKQRGATLKTETTSQ